MDHRAVYGQSHKAFRCAQRDRLPPTMRMAPQKKFPTDSIPPRNSPIQGLPSVSHSKTSNQYLNRCTYFLHHPVLYTVFSLGSPVYILLVLLRLAPVTGNKKMTWQSRLSLCEEKRRLIWSAKDPWRNHKLWNIIYILSARIPICQLYRLQSVAIPNGQTGQIKFTITEGAIHQLV